MLKECGQLSDHHCTVARTVPPWLSTLDATIHSLHRGYWVCTHQIPTTAGHYQHREASTRADKILS